MTSRCLTGFYRAIEAGTRSPDLETWNWILALYGWPQMFVGSR